MMEEVTQSPSNASWSIGVSIQPGGVVRLKGTFDGKGFEIDMSPSRAEDIGQILIQRAKRARKEG